MAEVAPDPSLTAGTRPAGQASGAASSATALLAAAAAALLASSCCVLPLVLALVGISGAWISQLRWFAPYSSALIIASVALLAVVGVRLYRTPPEGGPACGTDTEECENTGAAVRRWFWLVALLTLMPILVPLLAPMFY